MGRTHCGPHWAAFAESPTIGHPYHGHWMGNVFSGPLLGCICRGTCWAAYTGALAGPHLLRPLLGHLCCDPRWATFAEAPFMALVGSLLSPLWLDHASCGLTALYWLKPSLLMSFVGHTCRDPCLAALVALLSWWCLLGAILSPVGFTKSYLPVHVLGHAYKVFARQ